MNPDYEIITTVVDMFQSLGFAGIFAWLFVQCRRDLHEEIREHMQDLRLSNRPYTPPPISQETPPKE